MTKTTDDAAGTGALKFVQLARSDIKQDAIHDFVAHTTDGFHIALIGSKLKLVTLELTAKINANSPFPYVCATYEHNADRPLDKLARHVNMLKVYEACNVLEIQQLSLEPVYVALCSSDTPLPKLMAVSWSQQLLANGHLLLATLSSQGALTLLSKPAEHTRWRKLKALDVASTLSETILPPYALPSKHIENFKQFQAYMDRSWITAFAWMPHKDGDKHLLLLGTAEGSIFTLTLSADAQTLLQHSHSLSSGSLHRICYMRPLERQLLLVADIKGLVHLYSRSDDGASLRLVKPLWQRADRMCLQHAEYTYCAERDCYYIAICKGAHLLVWSMPRNESDDAWLQTQLYVGGMKITALCAVGTSSFAAATALSQLQRIQLTHSGNKLAQLGLSMETIGLDDCEDYQLLGLCSSRHNNLLTLFNYRKKEYAMTLSLLLHSAFVRVGQLQEDKVLAQFAAGLDLNEPINHYMDLVAAMRLNVANKHELQRYTNYEPLEHFAFDELATEAQQQRLQIKYHILDALLQMQQTSMQHSYQADQTKSHMDYLLIALTLTHMRLRLQHLRTLGLLTEFQLQAQRCMLGESARLRGQMERQLLVEPEHPLHATIKRFLAQMAVHFEALEEDLKPTIAFGQTPMQLPRCSVSFVELEPTLDQRYCSICARKAAIDEAQLRQLYAPGSALLCPYCRGFYRLDLFAA